MKGSARFIISQRGIGQRWRCFSAKTLFFRLAKTACFLLVAAFPASAWSQGTIRIDNAVFNWTARGLDGRTGEYLEGSGWFGQMYYSPDLSASDEVFVPVPGPPAVFGTRGIFDQSQNLERVLPDVPQDRIVLAQFRAWNAAAGATYEEAAASPFGVVGKSNIGIIETGGLMGTPGDFERIVDFAVYPVPEPAVRALCLLTGLALFCSRKGRE